MTEGFCHIQAQGIGDAGLNAASPFTGRESATESRINQTPIRGMRRALGLTDLPLDVGAGAEAGVEQAACVQPVQHGAVFREVLGLDADVSVPVQAEPGEVFHDGHGEFGAAAGAVDILDAEEETAAGVAGPAPGGQRGVGVAEVQVAGGAGGEAGGDGHAC